VYGHLGDRRLGDKIFPKWTFGRQGRDVLRCRRARQQTVEARLTKLWTDFRDGERSAYRLLRAAANVYCPSAV